MKKFDKIKNKMHEKAREISSSIEEELKTKETKKGTRGQGYNKSNYMTGTSNPEQVIGTMYSYFAAFWIGTFISMIAILFLLPNQKTWFLAILIIIAWPFWAVFCLFMMIPEVKIFGVTIFSRKNLSLRQSVSFGKRLLYAFSREFYRSNPTMFTFLLVYLILVLVAIFMAIS